MITFELTGGFFNYRVAAIVEHDGHVLVGREEVGDFWFLPGGRCELMESSPEAVKREFQEEFGVGCNVERLVWIAENFFTLGGRTCHEIGLYFLVSLPLDSPLLDKAKRFQFTDAAIGLEARWFPLAEIPSINLVPAFLRTGLLDLPSTTQHIVWDELGH